MPIIKSAKKRVRVTKSASIRNAKTKRALKTAIKDFLKSPSAKTLSVAESKIDMAAKKNVIHANKAARQKRQLAVQAKAAGVKTTAVKKAASKPAAKPAATKKAPAKKPAAKKTTAAKKPAAKKSSTKKS